MQETIFRRYSCRSYTGIPLSPEELSEVELFLQNARPLFPEIKTRFEFREKSAIRSLQPWLPPQVLAAYSEPKEGDLENIGFLLQQLDLYLQAKGIGVCWVGLGKPTEKPKDGMEFVILLAFGNAKEFSPRRGEEDFSRRPLSEISDIPDERLTPARLAPSAVNSQPWYFTHEGEVIHVYRFSQGLRKALTLGRMNRIDMGIALAQLYLANPDTFRLLPLSAPELQGYHATATITL